MNEDYTGPLEPFEFSINDKAQSDYLEALEDYHLRYVLSHDGIQPIVHPGVLLNQSNATRSPSFDGPNTRWIHVREQTQFVTPARVDDQLIARWQVEEHEPWFGRALIRVSCVLSRRDGKVILRRLFWGFHTSAQQPIPADGRRPISPNGASIHSGGLDSEDWDIPGKRKNATSTRIKLFSGRTANNLHTDEQIARNAGLPAPVASATQGMGYLCEFMIDNFGEQWLAGGSWELTFRKPVFPGDEVSASGRFARLSGNAPMFTIGLRLVNQRGTLVTQGTATGQAGSICVSPRGRSGYLSSSAW